MGERRWATDAARDVSYVYIKRRLHPGLLDAMVRGGAQALEIFAARGHFNYHDKDHVKEVGNWFKSEKIEFHSIHAPIYMDNNFNSGGQPVNIVDPDKRNRIEAMDEMTRAIEVADDAFPLPDPAHWQARRV